MLMGDFNGHLEGWSSPNSNTNGKALRRFAEHWNLEILPNSEITFTGRHGEKTCIDYVLIPRDSQIAVKGHGVWTDCPIKSDHRPITTDVIVTKDMSANVRPARIRTALLRQTPY